MTTLNRLPAVLLLAAIVPLCWMAPATARDADVGALHASWRGCLHRNFDLQALVTSRTLAVESAVKSCRSSEAAYLAALSTSPLVDDEDVSRVRPALIQRAKGWLLSKASGTRPL
jgi:hypothetical protein